MISKEAQNIDHFMQSRFFFDSARSAFYVLLNNLLNPAIDIILIPSYIGESITEGSGVFDPIRRLGLGYHFYALKEDLQIDMEDFESRLQEPCIRAVLVIHYFGFPQKEIAKIKRLCKEKHIFVIEDCAHTLDSCLDGIPVGQIGDFALFSIHKILPSKGGGFLCLNRKLPIDANNSISLDDLSIFCNARLKQISAKRIQNYMYYLHRIRANSSLYHPLFPRLPDGTVPLNFPILIEGNREKLYYELQKRNIITVALWYKLIDELTPQQWPASYELSRKILNLPVHQDTEFEDIDNIINVLESLENTIRL